MTPYFPFKEVVPILRKEKAFQDDRDGLAIEKVQQIYNTPYAILIATILSLRTKEEVTILASTRLLQQADTPTAMLGLTPEEVEQLIYPVGFYHTKADTILEISRILLQLYDGEVPNELEHLLDLPGVGRKTANLVLILAFDKDGICVDTHVHRIMNRWGIVQTKNANETEMALRQILPKEHWKEINGLLVSFGRNVCKPIKPLCEQCKIYRYCNFWVTKQTLPNSKG